MLRVSINTDLLFYVDTFRSQGEKHLTPPLPSAHCVDVSFIKTTQFQIYSTFPFNGEDSTPLSRFQTQYPLYVYIVHLHKCIHVHVHVQVSFPANTHRWVDIPFTREESLQADKTIKINCKITYSVCLCVSTHETISVHCTCVCTHLQCTLHVHVCV